MDQSGCGEIWGGSTEVMSVQSFLVQLDFPVVQNTLLLIFNWLLDRGSLVSVSEWGILYRRHRSQSWLNQRFEDLLLVVSMHLVKN